MRNPKAELRIVALSTDPVAVNGCRGLTGLVLPCLIFEDDHLLVANKPAGLNTHAPNPFAGEGLYEWLRHREPGWSSLAIVHRLDKDTSGLIVFTKTPQANRSLTEQFTARRVSKKYVLLTDRPVSCPEFKVRSCIVRTGDKYVSRSGHAGAEAAETSFKICRQDVNSPYTMLEAAPKTGRTHQIRVHAAEKGFPILGDSLYGGTPWSRVCLHAAELAFQHPATGKTLRLQAPEDFFADSRLTYRLTLLDPKTTTAFRLIQGASDGWPGWYVDRLGEFLLSESSAPLTPPQREELARLMTHFDLRGAYHRAGLRRQTTPATAGPPSQLVLGKPAPDRFTIMENGLSFELSFAQGGSTGLFLDQRDNRRRLLTGHVGAGFSLVKTTGLAGVGQTPSQKLSAGLQVLNAFSYTCGFSVCAAKAGAQTTSVDLSKHYLEWGQRNFQLNHLEPTRHQFLCGEVFDWLRRLAKQRRQFDLILLDPPTFSRSKQSGAFRAETDFGRLVSAALPLLKGNGVIFASSNAATWSPEKFLASLQPPLRAAGLDTVMRLYFPQPPDFRISRAAPAYLKTVWLRVEGLKQRGWRSVMRGTNRP